MSNKLSYNRLSCDEELHSLLEIIGNEYPISENSKNGINIRFKKQAKGLDVCYSNNEAEIAYSSLSEAARGIGQLLSRDCSKPWELSEELPFNTFGILIDCSRNATLKVDYFKTYLTRLALMGYNMAMLYTKDGYDLPGEDFFGYLRGKYTIEQLQEIDSFASKLGIEMIGSIQALGHLEPTLKWPAYYKVKDTSSVILTSEEQSYELIQKMIEFWSKAFKSRRIHLGMDETHDLGRGRYMDQNGYKRGYDLFNDHLKRVAGVCDQIGLKPIIWSDMYFRLGSKDQNYYDHDLVIPEDVKHDIPESVELNYWDYYHDDEVFYREWIKKHRESLGFEPLMASGIWSWDSFWNDYEMTVKTAVPCIDACIKEGVKDFFFTVWADDGAFYNLESVLAGACSMAEKAYSKNNELNEEQSQQLFDAVCKSKYLIHKKLSQLSNNRLSNEEVKTWNDRAILWDDPLLQIYRKNQCLGNPDWQKSVRKAYRDIYDYVEVNLNSADDCLEYAKQLVKVMILKLELLDALDLAYEEKDHDALQQVVYQIPEVISSIDVLLVMFRKYQYARYNPQGFELLQIRLGGLKERFKELQVRLEEFISGKVDSIPELDEKAGYDHVYKQYIKLATASYFV